MDVADLLQNKLHEVLRITACYGAHNVRVFGSVARGEAGPDSDLDLLVELGPDRSLFDLISIQQELEDLLGRRVHVLTEAAVSPYMRDGVLKDAIAL